MPKKILVLNWRDIKNPKSGGGDIVIHRIAKYLVDNGYEICLLCSSFPNAKKQEVIDGVKVIRSGSEYFLPITGFMYYLKNLKRKPDIIFEVINVIPWFLPLYSKIPQIAHIHQTQTQQRQNSKSTATSSEANVIIRLLVYFFEKLIPIFYRKIEFVTLSNSIKNDIASLGLREKMIHVVSPGIDEIKQNTSVKKNEKPTIVYVGRLKKYKGVQYLIQSLHEIIQVVPDTQLIIIGKGDYENKLRKQISKYNLELHVQLLGYISKDEKNDILQSAWMLVIPSLNEGWCIPVIEAGSLGTPTIGFDNGGLNDSIQNNVTGLLVESENVKELTEKIMELISNEDLRNKLAKNAQNFSTKFFWPQQLKKYLKIIESIE